MWKFVPEEKVVITYFPCSIAEESCKRLKVSDGFFKAYFPDGFVLTISSSGEVLEHYYLPSEQHKKALDKNYELYGKADFENLPEELKKRLKTRIKDMRKFLKGETIDIFSIEELNKGQYKEALKKIDNSGLKSILYFLLGENEIAKETILKAKESDIWFKRASAIILLDKDALKELSEDDDDMDNLIIAIAYAKTGDIESSRKAYERISNKLLRSKSAFIQDLIKAFEASLTPYLAKDLDRAYSFEKANKLSEALKIYQAVFNLSNISERKKIISRVSSIFKKEPKLRELPEEARKHIVVASMLFERKRFKESLEECKKALHVAPFTPIAFKGIAKCYGALELYEQAIENMSYYLELSPDAQDARECKDDIYRWEFLLKEKTGSKSS
ncbi:MAG: hypothetical protein NZ900_01735 [Synergistetes bacterium]|nr:hypothetical protein [Synergistota bacterium]MDW8191648.1 hypothetical protein [Synergistota bacterium]